MQARFAEVNLYYEGVNISRDIAPFLINFTYNDNASDKADDIAITLQDRTGLWLSDWFPVKGDKLNASVILHDWERENDVQTLPCGTFEIDEITCSGPPSQISIKAVSTLITKPMCSEKHTKAWENVRLSSIAGDFANKSGLKLFWDCESDPLFERRDQIEISDLEFLNELARDYGVNVKVTDTQLVCYSRDTYEEKSPVDEINITDKKLISWSFSSKARGTYKSAHFQYHDPVKNVNYETTINSDSSDGSTRILEINQKCDSLADAQKIAKERLDSANKKEITGSLNLMGDLRYIGGSNIKLTGFGAFDGVYVIESATHNISGGYTTSIKLSMNKESKKEKVTAKSKRAASRKRKSASDKIVVKDKVTKSYMGERVKIL